MEKIKITYEDVANYYKTLIRNGATEFTKPFNELKDQDINHKLTIQIFNQILNRKYNEIENDAVDIEKIRTDIKHGQEAHEIKLAIFNYYVQMLNSFKDEPSCLKAISVNTGLSETVVLEFLAQYNENLGLKYKHWELEQNIRPIFEKIWG